MKYTKAISLTMHPLIIIQKCRPKLAKNCKIKIKPRRTSYHKPASKAKRQEGMGEKAK